MSDPSYGDLVQDLREFRGDTARSYASHRRDVPDELIRSLAAAVDLGADDVVVDLGCGTGQLAVPISRVAGVVLGIDPEPDMLAGLRQRTTNEAIDNVVGVLAADHDLLTIARCVAPLGLIAIANALHWMDGDRVFRQARALLGRGSALAVVSQGPPMWLQNSEWSRVLREFLQRWTGDALRSHCGTDRATLAQRVKQLKIAGYEHVEVIEHPYEATVDLDFIAGHLRSAMSQATLPHDRVDEFQTRLASALEPYLRDSTLRERIDATAVVAIR